MYLWEIKQELNLLFAAQRDSELQGLYVSDVAMYSQCNLIFVDEMGCDWRDAIRRYGYGLRGMPVKCQKLLVRGVRISVIAAMTCLGILDVKIVHVKQLSR